MPSDIVLITALFSIAFSIREYLHYKQVTKLEELLKSIDIQDYYKATRGSQQKVSSPSANTIMDQPNEIMTDDMLDDIMKITKVSIDGVEKPITII